MARYRRVPRATVSAPATAAPADFSVTVDQPDPASLRKDELVEYAKARGVDTEGTKADILGRLEQRR